MQCRQPIKPNPAGVRLDPVSWRELAALVADGSERALGMLGRTPLQARRWVAGKWGLTCDTLQALLSGPI